MLDVETKLSQLWGALKDVCQRIPENEREKNLKPPSPTAQNAESEPNHGAGVEDNGMNHD